MERVDQREGSVGSKARPVGVGGGRGGAYRGEFMAVWNEVVPWHVWKTLVS